MADIPRIASTSRLVDIRGLRTHLREWRTVGATDASPMMLMLHGWMDVGASFQFVVDALQGPWRVMAPDWRGFGLTQRSTGYPGTASYWFPDYFADLDAMLDVVAPAEAPVHLVGHSMGGNVACLYAGIRPSRVATVVSIEGFGMPSINAAQAPARYARWLDAVKETPSMRTYANLSEVAHRLRTTNPRLAPDRAAFLAEHWSERVGERWTILGDPAHKLPNPVLYRSDETVACWRAVTAPVLWVEARETELYGHWSHGDAQREAALRAEFSERAKAFKDWRIETIDSAGHMVHHDQPERVAQSIERFIARCGTRDATPAL